ncbi:MAG: hypothetical protein IIZ41_11545, partial [Lachnospiraceae bacterium]|nr:hypothetical protein [Lachnospiraceae bacterium]
MDDNLAAKLAKNKGVRIIKDSSTIICFNYPATTEKITIDRIYVSVDGGNRYVNSVTGSSGATYIDDHSNDEVDVEINQKIIYNIQTSGQIELNASGGTFLIPKKTSYTDVVGSSTGWVVTAGEMINHAEWHYIYKAVSQESMRDGVGQIHFASRKSFTREWNGNNTKEDKTIFSKAGDYVFNWYETGADFNENGKTPVQTANQATNTVKFPILTFYSSLYEAKENNAVDYYIPEGQSKTFYYKVTEKDTGVIKNNAEISTGYINITLKVTNNHGIFAYQVDSETHLGDAAHTIYKNNDEVKLSGVEFTLGAFFNIIRKNTVTIDKVSVVGGEELNNAKIRIISNPDTQYAFYQKNGKLYSADNSTPNPAELKATYADGTECRLTPVDGGNTSSDGKRWYKSIEYTTSKEHGHVTISGLRGSHDGQQSQGYLIHEQETPGPGYTRAADIAFTMNADGSVTCENANGSEITMIDTKLVDIEVNKGVLGTNSFVGGAKLTITAVDSSVEFDKLGTNVESMAGPGGWGGNLSEIVIQGNKITYKDGGNGKVRVKNIPAGTYILSEDTAPTG